jgi:hypothetical protein
MYILLRHIDGSLEAGIVLAMGNDYIRVGVPGEEDAVELTFRDGNWVSDTDGLVEIECIGGTADDEWNDFLEKQLALHDTKAWPAEPPPPGCVHTPAPSNAYFN